MLHVLTSLFFQEVAVVSTGKAPESHSEAPAPIDADVTREVEIDVLYCGVCHSDLHTARQAVVCTAGFHTGSDFSIGSLTARPAEVEVRGVTVSMICPSVNASPCHRKCDSRSTGAFVVREPTMNRR